MRERHQGQDQQGVGPELLAGQKLQVRAYFPHLSQGQCQGLTGQMRPKGRVQSQAGWKGEQEYWHVSAAEHPGQSSRSPREGGDPWLKP